MKNTILSFIVHRELVFEIVKRDLRTLNKGSILGLMWLVIGPLFQAAVYVAIVAFATRGQGLHPFDFVLYVLSGMIPWQIMTRALLESPGLIMGRMDFVKQIIYPVETLPLTGITVSFLSSLVTLGVLIPLAIFNGTFHWTYVLVPIPFALLMIFALGIYWVFSIVGIIIRDLAQMVGLVLGVLVYLSPVVLSETLVGPKFWRFILLNPLGHPVICFRDALQGTFHPLSWIVFCSMAVLMFLLGAWVIGKAKVLINEYI